MGVLRFPNPGSDISKFIGTFSELHSKLQDKKNFTHDDSRDVLLDKGLVSSSGAIGEEAKRRSLNADRSLDPLYNQLKMYSELYRMLGWYQPGTMNTNFNFTELSSYVADADQKFQKRLFEECLLNIVFPNHLLENRSGNNIRPFPLILQIASNAGGIIFRDEIIHEVLILPDDRAPDAVHNAIKSVIGFRGNLNRYLTLTSDISAKTGIQVTTLGNYTRFIIGSLKFTGWFESVIDRASYKKSIIGLRLTEYGMEVANGIAKMVDIRYPDIAKYDLESRAAFTLLMHYTFLERCGAKAGDVHELLIQLQEKCSVIFEDLKLPNRQSVLYSPIQQSTAEDVELASKLDPQ